MFMLYVIIRRLLFFGRYRVAGCRSKVQDRERRVMKYIECNHCQKRYPSNPKFEEGARLKKNVRCTNCKEAFQIVVYEVKDGKSQPVEKRAPRDDEKFLTTMIRNARIDL